MASVFGQNWVRQFVLPICWGFFADLGGWSCLWREGGGGCGEGASNPIAKKIAEKCRAVAKPPKASRSDTSAQGTHRAPTRTRGGPAKSICGKIAENCEKLRKIPKNCEKLQKKIAKKWRKIADLNPPPFPVESPMFCFGLRRNYCCLDVISSEGRCTAPQPPPRTACVCVWCAETSSCARDHNNGGRKHDSHGVAVVGQGPASARGGGLGEGNSASSSPPELLGGPVGLASPVGRTPQCLAGHNVDRH